MKFSRIEAIINRNLDIPEHKSKFISAEICRELGIKTEVAKICSDCGTLFWAKTKRSKYCRNACRQAATRKRNK